MAERVIYGMLRSKGLIHFWKILSKIPECWKINIIFRVFMLFLKVPNNYWDLGIFLVRMHRFFLTLDTIYIYLLFYSNFCAKKIRLKDLKVFLRSSDIFSYRNLIKLSIKYQSYQKSRKVDVFEQKICISHNQGLLYHRTCKPDFLSIGLR